MARDCPDRARGADWRNNAPAGMPGQPAGRIGGGDAHDREYEVRAEFPIRMVSSHSQLP